MQGKRGTVLILSLAIALVCALMAYTIHLVARSQQRQARVWRRRASAQYLAEAGLVVARERLVANPAYCGGTEQIDTTGDQVGDAPVQITVSVCGPGNEQQDHEIRARAVY